MFLIPARDNRAEFFNNLKKKKIIADKPLSMLTFHLDIFISAKIDCLCVES